MSDKLPKYVRVTKANNQAYWYAKCVGEIFEVFAIDSNGIEYCVTNEYKYVLIDDCEPVIEHDGKFYREVERRAEVGELIRETNGDISKVFGIVSFDEDIRVGVEINEDGLWVGDKNEYHVLEPVDPTPDITDQLASLALKHTDLTKRVDNIATDLRTFAEQTTTNAGAIRKLTDIAPINNDGYRDLQHAILDADLPLDIRLHLIAELDAKQDELLGKLAQLRAMDE